jgi:4-amino-4-deoxychorismate lyase
MCRFVESIQLNNGEFKRLGLHQERVRLAMKDYFPTLKVFDLVESLTETTFPLAGLYKCRVVYDSKIRKIEYIPYIRRGIHSLKLVETQIESTHYKPENRNLYMAAN